RSEERHEQAHQRQSQLLQSRRTRARRGRGQRTQRQHQRPSGQGEAPRAAGAARPQGQADQAMTSILDARTRALSVRAHRIPASPIRRLAPLADAAKTRGTKVYHLNIGQPDIETPAPMLARLKEIDARVIEYSPSAGTPEFLRSMQRYYRRRVGVSVGVDQILATTGGSEAILFALMACADAGDDLLVVEPFYANYAAFAAMADLNLTAITARGRDGFHLPPRDVWERALTPRTRAVIVCNPNNPTGTVYSREELECVADFCRDNGLFLISDEVYREFVYDGHEAFSALNLP